LFPGFPYSYARPLGQWKKSVNERTRYAWGDTASGTVLVAMADSEVVFFGFPAREDTAIKDL
jgi:hypothetical protein